MQAWQRARMYRNNRHLGLACTPVQQVAPCNARRFRPHPFFTLKTHLLPTMFTPAGLSTTSQVPMAVSCPNSAFIASSHLGQSGHFLASSTLLGSRPIASTTAAAIPTSSTTSSRLLPSPFDMFPSRDGACTPGGKPERVLGPVADPTPARMSRTYQEGLRVC